MTVIVIQEFAKVWARLLVSEEPPGVHACERSSAVDLRVRARCLRDTCLYRGSFWGCLYVCMSRCGFCPAVSVHTCNSVDRCPMSQPSPSCSPELRLR